MSNILLIGSGGREHALALKLSSSEKVSKIMVLPGNAGILSVAKVQSCSVRLPGKESTTYDELIKYCHSTKIDLVIVGPEEHLEKAIVETLTTAGILCFGPTSEAAKLETSKVFAKDFMYKNEITTARYASFTDSSLAIEHIENCDYKAWVVKASGLAAGKGVTVAMNNVEAIQAVKELLDDKKFKEAGAEIVIEELLEGQEISALAFTDGQCVKLMPFAQDHKRLLDNDRGPNTGGMGAYAPVFISEEDTEIIKTQVLQKTVDCIKQCGTLYKGVLYAGIMLTKRGPLVLEFNCRFGDPETQVLMRLLKSDLYDVLLSCVKGNLAECQLEWSTDDVVCGVVMASGGYPDTYATGYEITGLSDIEKYEPTAVVFHAGTKLINDGPKSNGPAVMTPPVEDVSFAGEPQVSIAGEPQRFTTDGGRVLCVTAVAGDLLRARNAVYCACSRLHFLKCYYRCDIGAKSLDAPASYLSSGVSIESGNKFVDRIKRYCSSTARTGSSSIGGFGGAFNLKAAGYEGATLISGTDGVGTKLKVAHECDMHESIGIDLVAMCVNDILVHSAEPLFFLDYFATGKLDIETAAKVVKGIAEGCKQAGCALIGGETAEMPGFYDNAEYDIAGFAVGAVDNKQEDFPYVSKIKNGDIVLGLASSGIHSNGFSLVRKIVRDMKSLSYDEPCPWQSEFKTVGEALLQPTKIYVKNLLPILRDDLLKAAAHITGGGLLENIPRVLPKNLAVQIDASKWTIPDIFKWLCFHGRVPHEEMCRTFNCGLGMVLILAPENVDVVRQRLQEAGEIVYLIGHVTRYDQGTKTSQVEICGVEKIFQSYPLLHKAPKMKMRVAVLISGTGSNFKALLDHSLDVSKNSCFAIVCVVSNVAAAKGLQYAEGAGIPYKVIPHAGKTREVFDGEVDTHLKSNNVELVCLAGFMRILSAEFVRKWHGRMLNVHPSLLPSFKGHDALRQTLRAGARLCGSTVQFVSADVDSGAVIAQTAAPCRPEVDDEAALAERVKRLEWRMYPAAVEAVAGGRATLTADGKVIHRYT